MNFICMVCFLAEVEVDTSTGKTKVESFKVIDDVGKIGNILAVNGQAYGGISHTIGYALSENYEDVKKHTNIFFQWYSIHRRYSG